MSWLNSILILGFAFLAVVGEATIPAPRYLLGAQIDLLPALMVYAASKTDLLTVSLLALLGGMGYDSFSANPLGISILPLMAVGFPVYLRRDLILRDLPFAQYVLGAAASGAVPLLVLLFLLNGGRQPLVGWGTLWQWLVMTAGGSVATPAIFRLFGWLNHVFGYQLHSETSFRSDREIQRGRSLR